MAYLRDYQTAIMARIIDEWQRCKSVMVQMPTGTGKTRVLAALVNEELKIKNETTEQTGCVWIVAHRRELVEQIKETVEQYIIGLDRTTFHNAQFTFHNAQLDCDEQLADSELRFINGSDRNALHNWLTPNCVSQLDNDELCLSPINNHEANHNFPLSIINSQLSYTSKIKVLSIQWLARHWEDMKDERPSLIVIDEAHHALADTYTELWRRYPEAKKLGMTATPCRMNRKGFTDLFEVLVTSESIADFIKQGWLSVFDYASIKDDSNEQKLIDSLNRRGADGDYQVKEMNAVLNKRPSIAKLYESMKRYADGKKGIVYAISIEHARNIAAYYTEHGISAAAIDSRTPAKERKRLVDDFKAGRIKVMVNVDVFSEGFDCPDVEFVQMARPTLSLAKYLQQVGRGLRMSKGKNACMLIDNVGLYRMFGLPVAKHDWQAMFEGRKAGKGCARTTKTVYSCMARDDRQDTALTQNDDMEMVMNHDRLMEYLTTENGADGYAERKDGIKAFKDRTSGLYGLKRGDTITAKAQYVKVLDTDGDMAAVRFNDGRVGVVKADGELIIKIDRYNKMRFMKDKLLGVTDNNNKEFYIDLRNGRLYKTKPEVMNYGGVEILKVNGKCYSRTKNMYEGRMSDDCMKMYKNVACLRICDYLSPPRCRQVSTTDDTWVYDSVCLLADDYETYYHFCGQLADLSIVIEDMQGKYYLVEEGKPKRYIACERPKTEDEDFDKVTAKLKADAEKRASERKTNEKHEQERKRKDKLEKMKRAIPFKSGLRWGLKLDDRIIVPPIYRNIQQPVGNYCAVETSPKQWGVIMLDGKIVVEARYMNVEISSNGTARLTVFPGKTKTVKLKES